MTGALDYLIVTLAAAAAGAVNALAGGGTLISFPVLVALGIPAVEANVTNTVALSPGYLGATVGQAADLAGQRRRLWLLIPIGTLCGIAGGVLLLSTGEDTFRGLVPWLILLATALVAVQKPVRRWVEGRATRHADPRTTTPAEQWAIATTGAAAIYGGYFGAGLSVIVLAALGLTLDDTLTRLNALKQAISLAVNSAAALLFVFSGRTVWPVAAAMAIGAVAGGVAGGRLAGRVRPDTLRRVVVVVGTAVGIAYLVG